MPVIYNQPNTMTLTTSGGPIQVYNDLQVMVDRWREGFNVELKRHIEGTGGKALIWMHHSYTRDALRAFDNDSQSTPMIRGEKRYDLTRREYEDHLRTVEAFAFNWEGVIFSFVGLEGPKYDQVQQHLQFLERQAHLRTNSKPLAIAVVPTFTAVPLPYLAVDGRSQGLLETAKDGAFRFESAWYDRPDWLNWFTWYFSPSQKHRRLVWGFFNLYLNGLGVRFDKISHIGERYSDIRNGKSGFANQENNRCVRGTQQALGGKILPDFCFPGKFGGLFDPALQ